MTPWKKHYPLTDKNAFICLVDHMGDDSSIVQAARVSYGKDEQAATKEELLIAEEQLKNEALNDKSLWPIEPFVECRALDNRKKDNASKDRQLIRYLMNHSHTTPFEMVEIKFMVQVPMDCWRQWIRHRTASVNEYSTRYTEALDFFQVTDPYEWRLQATDNKQGSSGFLEEWPPVSQYISKFEKGKYQSSGHYLSEREKDIQTLSLALYNERLQFGIAKEQARKDLPLSTYTRAYWKCDLHNIFNFLRLRMDSHAQIEIRSFANCMFNIVKEICPVACEAFEDYVLHAKKFSRMEMEVLREQTRKSDIPIDILLKKPDNMTDREWKEFLTKIG